MSLMMPIILASVSKHKTKSAMKHIQIFMLTVLSNLAFAVILHAATGDLDPSFAGSGTKRLRFGFGEDFAYAVAVQPDGKVVVAGTSTTAFLSGTSLALVRYGTNNILDPSFGDGGKVIAAVSVNTNASAGAAAVQVQRNGKIVVAGTLYEGTNSFALLVRFNPDGSLDSSFGQGGIVTNSFSFGARGNAVVIQPDDKIVLAGLAYAANFNSEFALARYQTNGEPDLSFGNIGTVSTPANGGAQANGVTLQADGKIVAAGNGGHDFAVIRYTTNGVLDTTFGPDRTGKVFTHLGSSFSDSSRAMCVAIEPGDNIQTLDRIVVGGYTQAFDPPQFEVVRYKLDGSLDGMFGGTGIVTIPAGSGFINIANALVVQGTGIEPRKIILAGYSFSNSKYDFCIVRFNENGTPDNTFDGDGRVFTSFGSDQDAAYGAALVPGGKLLVVGSTLINQNNDDFALARYNLSDGSLDISFDGDGKMTQDIGEHPSLAKAVAIQADGKIIVAGGAINGINYGGTHSIALTRFNPDGVMDMSFGHFGKATATFGEQDSFLNALAIQPDGRIVGAGFTGTNFLVVRYTTNGVLDTSFNGNGIATTSLAAAGNIANAIALQSDGKIVIVGTISFGVDFAILRYNPNGTLDASFDGDGKVTVAVDPGINQANAVKILSDGKIVVAGYSGIGGTTIGFTAVRLRTNGVVDSSFGTFGVLATVIGTPGCIGTALALQPDGKFLIAGYSANGTDVDFALARYDTNGVLDTTFDGDGKVTTPIGLSQDMAMAMGLQSDGKIILAGNAIIVGRQEFVALRYHANGDRDTSYGVNGNAFVDFNDRANNNLFALAMDASGRPVVVGDAGGFFGIARLQADPRFELHSVARLSNGHTVLQGVGAPNGTYLIQASTSLLPGSFTTVGTSTADGDGLWQYNDSSAANLPRRFYRLTLP
jgi:uncharacterized delta-60 repeat protein